MERDCGFAARYDAHIKRESDLLFRQEFQKLEEEETQLDGKLKQIESYFSTLSEERDKTIQRRNEVQKSKKNLQIQQADLSIPQATVGRSNAATAASGGSSMVGGAVLGAPTASGYQQTAATMRRSGPNNQQRSLSRGGWSTEPEDQTRPDTPARAPASGRAGDVPHIHEAYMSVVWLYGKWVELTCSHCGTNCSNYGGNVTFLRGLGGFKSHHSKSHKGMPWKTPGDPYGFVDLREVSAKDMSLMQKGLEPVDVPVEKKAAFASASASAPALAPKPRITPQKRKADEAYISS